MSQMTREDEELLRRVVREELEKLHQPLLERVVSLQHEMERVRVIALQKPF
jgi:hypothetical protein